MLRAVVGIAHGTCGVEPVVALTVYLRIVVGPLGIFQLAVECGIYNHIAFHQCIVIHSIKGAADDLVGRV